MQSCSFRRAGSLQVPLGNEAVGDRRNSRAKTQQGIRHGHIAGAHCGGGRLDLESGGPMNRKPGLHALGNGLLGYFNGHRALLHPPLGQCRGLLADAPIEQRLTHVDEGSHVVKGARQRTARPFALHAEPVAVEATAQ